MEAEEIFFKIQNNSMNVYRLESIEKAKEGEDLIYSEVKVIEIFRGFFEKVVGVAELVSKKFIFKTNERTNSAKFGNWTVTQVNVTLNEIVANLSDNILASKKNMNMLRRRLSIEFCNFDTKGLSCSFILEEFFDK